MFIQKQREPELKSNIKKKEILKSVMTKITTGLAKMPSRSFRVQKLWIAVYGIYSAIMTRCVMSSFSFASGSVAMPPNGICAMSW